MNNSNQDRRNSNNPYSLSRQNTNRQTGGESGTARASSHTASSSRPSSPKMQKNKGENEAAGKKRVLKYNIIFFVLVVFCVAALLGLNYVSAKLDIMGGNETVDSNSNNNLVKYAKKDVIYDDEAVVAAPGVKGAYSYTDFSYKWQTNGAPLRSSKNVLNIVLLGIDGKDALASGGRSDSMILCSINKKTKKIKLTSFYRDTWTYMNVGNTETYNKMNAAYMFGKDPGIVSTLENNFKIDIDYYLAVDFSAFEDIINMLGGITVPVEEYEAKYINRTSVHNIDFGEAVHLDGWEALVFARVRKLDGEGDVGRTRRQRLVINALIDSMKNSSISQINEIVDKVFGRVRTDLSKMEILSYAIQALTNSWADFDLESVLLNDEEIYRTGYVGSSSVVFVEFPKVSEIVQTAVYGDSSVKAEDSDSVFSFLHRRSDGEWTIS